jgi:hypothetical protein
MNIIICWLQCVCHASRYRDHEAEQAAVAAALGPVQRSQGADLAQLLAQTKPFDRAHYFRARANLLEECGAPPEVPAGAMQGLSIDLEGLAACLQLMPKNRLLGTDAFSDDDEGWGWDAADDVPDLPEGEEEGASMPAAHQPAAAAQTQPVPSKAEPKTGASAASSAGPPQAAKVAATAAQAVPVPQPTAASPAGEEVNDLLSELLGEKATLGSLQQGQRQPLQAAPGVSAPDVAGVTGHADLQGPASATSLGRQPPQQPPPAATASAGFRPLLQQQQQRQLESFQPKQRVLEEEADDDLDMLLGLAPGRPGGQVGSTQAATESKSGAHSLEAWLEGL